MSNKPVVCFITNSAGDWGGASRVLFNNLRQIDREKLTPLLLLPRNGPIEPELEQLKLRYLIWGPLIEPGNPIRYIRAILRAWRFFKREHVAVIHVNSTNFWRPAEMFAARMLKIPIVSHYHILNTKPSPAAAHSTAAICVSRYVAESSLPKELVKHVIYNPIILDRLDGGISQRKTLGLDSNVIIVSFIGQVRQSKGIQDFLAMAAKIPNPAMRFLIAGECRDPRRYKGSYSVDDLHKLISSDSRIIYLGYTDRPQDVYTTSDIVVMPAREPEALGLVNLEAGACRKPVVATRNGGVPEVVHDGLNGFIVDVGDVEAITDRVSKLIADPTLRKKMGEAGRIQVEQMFTTQPVRELEAVLLKYASH